MFRDMKSGFNLTGWVDGPIRDRVDIMLDVYAIWVVVAMVDRLGKALACITARGECYRRAGVKRLEELLSLTAEMSGKEAGNFSSRLTVGSRYYSSADEITPETAASSIAYIHERMSATLSDEPRFRTRTKTCISRQLRSMVTDTYVPLRDRLNADFNAIGSDTTSAASRDLSVAVSLSQAAQSNRTLTDLVVHRIGVDDKYIPIRLCALHCLVE